MKRNVKRLMSMIIAIVLMIASITCVSAGEFVPCRVLASNLNCRTEASDTSDIITVFPWNTALEIIGMDSTGMWYEVWDGVHQGWCYAPYLKPQAEELEEPTNEYGSIGECLGTFTATYYTTSYAENGGYRVSTGSLLTDVVGKCIAVDPRVIPYYTDVYIACEGMPDIGYRTALDCGRDIIGNRIDILVWPGSIPSIGKHKVTIYKVNK